VLCEIQTVEVERRWHLWVDRFTHRDCRFTIGNSTSVIEHLTKFARIPHDRIRLVQGGIDVDRIRLAPIANRRGFSFRDETPVVFWAGRLDRVKGLPVLIRAFSGLTRKTPAHLLLAGDGPLRTSLERLVDKLGIASMIRLLGSRSDVPSLLKMADLFVFPSRTEGLPNALLEAMAAARPIVATDVAGNRDLIAHGRTGYLVPYGDTHALEEAMRELLTNRTLANRLGNQAFEEADRNWRIELTFDRYESLYEEVLARQVV
jgi:glycosyltransferase involved in cell wall biosynthesis